MKGKDKTIFFMFFFNAKMYTFFSKSFLTSAENRKDAESYTMFLFWKAPPPWENEEERSSLSSRSVYESSSTSRIVNSHSAPSQGLNTLASAPRLPRAQNPTITLLQKARGQQFSRKSFSLFSSKEKL